jgi:hypothetical protein
VEGPASTILATIAAVVTGKPYARLRDDDSGNLIKKLQSAGTGPWIEGLDDAIRNAFAHQDWSLNGHVVELRPGKAGSHSLGLQDLVDLVLRGVESLLALDAAVILAAGSVGIDFGTVDWRTALSLNDENAVRLLLAMAGWHDIDVTIQDDALRVSASAPSTAFSVGILGALAGVLRPTIESIHISVQLADGRTRSLEGLTFLVRAMQGAQTEDEKGIAMVELLHGFRLDEKPIANRAYVRRWSTALILRALQSPLGEAIKILRPVRELARRLEDEEHADLITDSMTLCRLYATGDIINPVDTDTFDQIRTWANLDVALVEF